MQILSIENLEQARRAMAAIGVTGRGAEIMAPKAVFQVIRLEQVDTRAANILKQTMLSQGAEAAVSAGTINLAQKQTDVLIMATVAQLQSAIPRLKEQPWGLKAVAGELEQYLEKLEAGE